MRYKFIILFIILIICIIILIFYHYQTAFDLYVQLCSKDPLTPFVDLSHRPSVKAIKKAYPIIREEMLKARDKFSAIRGDLFFEDSIIKDDKWKKIYLKWFKSKGPNYAYELFPETMKVIDSHKDIHLAMFSLMEPNCKILPHMGPMRGNIRLHLCLIGPNSPDCFIEVNGERYWWKEGEVVMLDDTFLHFVENNTEKERVVLFIDLEREMYLPFINKWVIKHIAPKTTRINNELEKKSYVKYTEN